MTVAGADFDDPPPKLDCGTPVEEGPALSLTDPFAIEWSETSVDIATVSGPPWRRGRRVLRVFGVSNTVSALIHDGWVDAAGKSPTSMSPGLVVFARGAETGCPRRDGGGLASLP